MCENYLFIKDYSDIKHTSDIIQYTKDCSLNATFYWTFRLFYNDVVSIQQNTPR